MIEARLAAMQFEVDVMQRALALIERHAALRALCRENGITGALLLPTMRDLALQVAARHGLSVAALKGPRTNRATAHPRQELMWLLYEQRLSDGSRRWSTPLIGQFLGGRDHTTVIYGIRQHERRTSVRP